MGIWTTIFGKRSESVIPDYVSLERQEVNWPKRICTRLDACVTLLEQVSAQQRQQYALDKKVGDLVCRLGEGSDRLIKRLGQVEGRLRRIDNEVAGRHVADLLDLMVLEQRDLATKLQAAAGAAGKGLPHGGGGSRTGQQQPGARAAAATKVAARLLPESEKVAGGRTAWLGSGVRVVVEAAGEGDVKGAIGDAARLRAKDGARALVAACFDMLGPEALARIQERAHDLGVLLTTPESLPALLSVLLPDSGDGDWGKAEASQRDDDPGSLERFKVPTD